MRRARSAASWALPFALVALARPAVGQFRASVVDSASGQALPCRVSIQGPDGAWHFAKSSSPDGSAVEHRKVSLTDRSIVEMHTTLSAHPFEASLAPGRYTITVERGKEYHTATVPLEMTDKPVAVTIKLRRWVDLPARGWYSGETHVHRSLEELPNLMLAEDLNVAFPLVDWVREAFVAPTQQRNANANAQAPEANPITVDPTHLIDPRNTEYELFTVGETRHTLGAFFVIRHKTRLDLGAPPVVPIAQRAHREGALIELDKHNWPWSLAIVPIMPVDLFELSNNHVWRTTFGLRAFGEAPAAYMNVERDEKGMTERGWLDFGFQTYYALLDCGFRLRPTAGTGSGVHPVPLGFSRVFVHLPNGFNGDAWFEGLNAGRVFVTTGPMLFATLDEQGPGQVFTRPGTYRLSGTALAPYPLKRIELIVNGELRHELPAANRPTDEGAYESPIAFSLPIDSTSWVAVRCFEDRPDGRPRFAHTAPWHIDVPDRPLRPRKEEIAYLLERTRAEIARSSGLLPPEAQAEYRKALMIYEAIARSAR